MKHFLFILCAALLLTTWQARSDVIDLSDDLPLAGAYLVPLPKAEFVRVQLLLDVGEVDYDGPEGLAHYLEHLVWFSADKVHGTAGKNRIANAWTNIFFTNYWNLGAPEKLSDMLAASAAVFGPVDLRPSFARTERDVVAREFDLSFLDRPYRQLYTAMGKALMPENPAARSVIGTRESIAQITPERAIAFKDLWYHPKNARLLITGPVTADDVKPLLQQHFAGLPRTEGPDRTSLRQPVWDGRRVETTIVHPKLTAPIFHLLFKAPMPPGMSREEANHTANMLGRVLNSSGPGTPRKALYYDDFIVEFVDVDAWWDQTDTLNLSFTAGPDPDTPLEEAIATLRGFVSGLTEIDPEAFDPVRSSNIDTIAREKGTPEFASNAAFDGLLQGRAPYPAQELVDGFEAVTLERLNAMLEIFQTQSISVLGIAHPEEKQ